MKDGVIRKVKSCFNSERVRTRDSSLEVTTESFRIGKVRILLVTRLDGREDILMIQTYLVDAEIPFLCGKRTLEDWSFQIDRREKILEITSKMDGSRI